MNFDKESKSGKKKLAGGGSVVEKGGGGVIEKGARSIGK